MRLYLSFYHFKLVYRLFQHIMCNATDRFQTRGNIWISESTKRHGERWGKCEY